MLPIYLSSSAFNYVAMTSYTHFSFLQHVRFSAFFPEPDPTPQSPSDQDHHLDPYYDASQSPWKSGIAETCFFYSQNLPTVLMLLPRAGLSMALLFAFSKPPAFPTPMISLRDQTFFKSDGSLTDYARGVLFANAAWTAWRLLVLMASWSVASVASWPFEVDFLFYRLGLWIVSKQRLAGLCGPRHTWEESEQEKSRSIYSEAVSESGPYRSSFYHDGDGALDYAGDELAWEWREATRMRVQDAFEFCLTSGRGSSGTAGAADLRWSSVSSNAVYGALGYKNRRYTNRHQRWKSAKGKEPSNEKPELGAEDIATSDEGFEGIEKVLAAVGFPSTASPSRRGLLSEDLFAAPASFALPTEREPQKQEYTVEPLRYHNEEPGPSTGMFTDLEPPKMAKRNSKDKVPSSSTGGAPLLNLPYPFIKPGSGQVSSNDLALFPVAGIAKQNSQKSQSSSSANDSKSGSSTSKSTSGESVTGSGEDDEEDEDEEGDEFDSEEPSEPASGSGSMSSLGHPISPSRYPFGTRRPGAGHARTPSGVSSGISSGAGLSGGSHAHTHSMSSSHGNKSVMGVSVLSQSTGNKDSTDSESGVVEGRSLSHGSSPLRVGVFPMPPRHPHPQGQGRGRSGTAPSTVHPQVEGRGRSGTAPSSTVAPDEIPDDDDDDDDDDLIDDDDNQDEQGEEDSVGLLVTSSPLTSHSQISLSATQSSSSGSLEARSRTHSSFSVHSSRSRHSSTRARSRTRTYSTHGPSVRERANSLGTSMRSLMKSTTASMTQLDLIMRGATGPAAGLGAGSSRPRSRVNSSMARLEENEVLSTSSAVPAATIEEMNERRLSGGNGSRNGSAEPPVSSLMVGRIRQELEEEYSSSGGTHSRSGSEMSGENYTFGRPVLFMRPVQEQQDTQQEADEDEVVLVERSNRGSPNRSVIPMLSMTTEGGEPGSVSLSVSASSFYSQPSTSEATTASPGRGSTTPINRGSPSASNEHSPERQGLAIPWNDSQQQQPQEELFLLPPPPLHRWEETSSGSGSSASTSPAYISTVAESWTPTATVMTTSDDGRTAVVERPQAGEDIDGGGRRVV